MGDKSRTNIKMINLGKGGRTREDEDSRALHLKHREKVLIIHCVSVIP